MSVELGQVRGDEKIEFDARRGSLIGMLSRCIDNRFVFRWRGRDRRFGKERLEIGDPALAQQVFQNYMAHYTTATMHIYALEHSHAAEKLVYILQYLVARFGEPAERGMTKIDLRLSHQDIAEMVGLTRETTAVELHRLKDRGLISYGRFSYAVNVPALVAATGSDEFENVEV